MERNKYPTEKGIAISPYELKLPKPYRLETNNHHREFTEYTFGKNIILTMLRNLYVLQDELPLDMHNNLHCLFLPPELPTLDEAMYKLEEQKGGLLQIKRKGKGGYIKRQFTNEDYQQCLDYYNSFSG
jgi:hypothetical protein